MTGAAVHEQPDDRFGLATLVFLFGGERVEGTFRQPGLCKHGLQRHPAESGSGALKEVSAIQVHG